ncbi:MAG: large conductance mechanosensitive channel protein MscL [Clostridia bacterium]|nr:large conductance mechanosensitive channel protein MscL [Clostridia bacterium]
MSKKNKKKSTFFSDFKAFITKGNVMDMAVGVVIGGAFSAIVNSLVNDIIMPLLNLATGDGVQGLSVVLNGVEKYLEDGSINPEAVLWNYGNFLQTIINFLIIALCIFTTLRIIMNIRKASEKIAEKAKQDSKGDDQQVAEQALQEAVADVAEEASADSATSAEEVKTETALEEVKVEEPTEVVKEEERQVDIEVVVEAVEAKETQEDLLKQIRDLLATMQPKKSEKPSAAKSATKTTAKKTTKSAK